MYSGWFSSSSSWDVLSVGAGPLERNSMSRRIDSGLWTHDFSRKTCHCSAPSEIHCSSCMHCCHFLSMYCLLQNRLEVQLAFLSSCLCFFFVDCFGVFINNPRGSNDCLVGAMVGKCFVRCRVLIYMGSECKYAIDGVIVFGCWGLDWCGGVTEPLGGKNICEHDATYKHRRGPAVGRE